MCQISFTRFQIEYLFTSVILDWPQAVVPSFRHKLQVKNCNYSIMHPVSRLKFFRPSPDALITKVIKISFGVHHKRNAVILQNEITPASKEFRACYKCVGVELTFTFIIISINLLVQLVHVKFHQAEGEKQLPLKQYDLGLIQTIALFLENHQKVFDGEI